MIDIVDGFENFFWGLAGETEDGVNDYFDAGAVQGVDCLVEYEVEGQTPLRKY